VIAAAIESLSQLPLESAELTNMARQTVERIVREAPLTRDDVGSISQGGVLIQDAIGSAACRFFANHLQPEQVIGFLEEQLVDGTDQSSFRLQQLPGEREFVERLKVALPTLMESMKNWPDISKREPQQMATREFLRLCIFRIEDPDFQAVAERIRTEIQSR
jgi:hypothetical protein